MECFSTDVDLFDEFGNTAFVMVFNRMHLFLTCIVDEDFQSSVEKRCFFQSVVDFIKVEFKNISEDASVGFERDNGACIVTCPDGFQIRNADAGFKALLVHRSATVDLNLHPLRNSIHCRDADAVQTSAHFVGAVVEFPTSVEFCHDHFSCRDAEFFVQINGDATAMVAHREGVIWVQRDFHDVVVASEMFVDRIVDDLPNAVVQRRAVVRVTKVHPWSFSYRFKSFKNLNTGCIVFIGHVASTREVKNRVLRPRNGCRTGVVPPT